MVKKKVTRKKTSSSKRKVSKVKRSLRSSRPVKTASLSSNKRMGNVWASFFFFLIIFVISLVLYKVIPNVLLHNFFGVVSVISGVVAAALVLGAIVLAILRAGRR